MGGTGMDRMDGVRRGLRSSFKWIKGKAPMVKCLAYGERKSLSSGLKTNFFNQYFIKKLKGLLRGLPLNLFTTPF